MSERLTDAVREQAEAIWQIGNRHGPDAERKQDIAESLATFTEALRARVAKLETALRRRGKPGREEYLPGSAGEAAYQEAARDFAALKGEAAS